MGALWRLAVVVDLDLVAGVCSFCIVALGRRRVGFPVGRCLSGEGVVGAGLLRVFRGMLVVTGRWCRGRRV